MVEEDLQTLTADDISETDGGGRFTDLACGWHLWNRSHYTGNFFDGGHSFVNQDSDELIDLFDHTEDDCIKYTTV